MLWLVIAPFLLGIIICLLGLNGAACWGLAGATGCAAYHLLEAERGRLFDALGLLLMLVATVAFCFGLNFGIL